MAVKDIDIEYFPESEAAKRMLSRVSPIYGYSYIGKWLFQIMGIEMDEARMIIESLRDQCYLDRVTWGIRYWEERYGIEPDESLDMEFRRARIKRAGTRYGAISPAKIEEIMAAYTGCIVHVTEDNSHYSFDIEFETDINRVDYTSVIEKLNTIKPSHLSYRIVLPKSANITLRIASILHINTVIVSENVYRSGLSDLTWLIDEKGNVLIDENSDVLLET